MDDGGGRWGGWTTMGRSLAAIALVCLLSHHASGCQLSLSAAVSRARIAQIDLSIRHASTQVAKSKPGWFLSISNDPAWTTTLSAHAIVGAAFISKEELEAMLVFEPEPGFSCAVMEEGSTAVTLTFYVNDRLVRRRIGKAQFSFSSIKAPLQ